MPEHKLDKKLIGYFTTIENITNARVKDIFLLDNHLTVIVHQGEAGKAIGKKGLMIKRLTRLLNKKIKIIEFSDNPEEFIKHAIDPITIASIETKENTIIIHPGDNLAKGRIIGRNSKNITFLNTLTTRYYNKKAIIS